jgi:hypothetical protein
MLIAGCYDVRDRYQIATTDFNNTRPALGKRQHQMD